MLQGARELQPYLLGAAFVLLWVAEGWVPHHARATEGWRHARTNLVLTFLYVMAGIGFGALNAWLAQAVLVNKVGLLQWANAPAWVSVPLGVLALDLAAYAGHILKHRVPLLWRFHQVHHSDAHLDVTSGFRFHPVEALISWLFLAPVILAAGVSAAAILIFAGLYALAALVQHANIRLPGMADRTARVLFVSPGFHRVHHSPRRVETDANYGTLFSLWDRIFRTYRRPEECSGEFGLNTGATDSLRSTLWEPFLPRAEREKTSGLTACAPGEPSGPA